MNGTSEDKNPEPGHRKFSELIYSYEKGNYTRKSGYSYYKEGELVLFDLMKLNAEKLENIRKNVIAGKISPIAYFMELKSMNPSILSQYVGFSSRKVRNHLKPSEFRKLSQEILEKYASAFEISLTELNQPI